MGYGIKEVKGNAEGMVLKKLSINGNVCGSYAEISIHQDYENKGEKDIEGIYMFPIPQTALISNFEVEIGGRTLKTIVEEKEKAIKIYENAKTRGDNAFLLEEFKPRLFKISIGRIISGETVKIKLSYIDDLQYKDNTYKLVIPSIFEPRQPEEGTTINNLKQSILKKFINDDSEQRDFEFKTNILVESLCPLEFESPYNKLKVEREGDTVARINVLDEYESIDKDFVLIMKEQNPLEADGMIYEYKEGEQERGLVYIRMVPELEDFEEEKNESYVFLIDISETMKGNKIEQAKNALQLCIRNLSEEDTFDIVAMGDSLKYFWDEGMAQFNADTLRKASRWIDSLETESDADIFSGIKHSIENEGGHNTILIFTDDQVEEEEEILNYVRVNIGDNRIFTFGIDSATNNYFLNKLAHESYGKAEFTNKGERIEDVVLRQFNRIQNPEVEDMKIDWGTLKVESTYPRTIDYMYDREPFSIFADVLGDVSGEITIRGMIGNKEYVKKVNLDNFNTEENTSLLKKVWVRKRIKSIEQSMRTQRGEVKESMRRKVIELSKDTGLISPETTFIFLELRNEPVLGIELRNIIPIKVEESTLADKADLEEFQENDQVGFQFKSNNEYIKESDRKHLDDNIYLDRIYPREKLLRIIAKNQLADGAFVDYEDYSIEDKIETTAMVLLAFSIGNDDIDIYFNQLNKSMEFIYTNCIEPNSKLESRIAKMTILALNGAIEKRILKVKNLEKAHKTVSNLYKILTEREDTEEILNNLTDYSFKKSVISLFKVSEDGKSITEKIVISVENNSIFSMAKLAVLKGLKTL
ncbi:VIT and vWA domain-containing protein [Clostridium magnum]|uniref:Vault protein inter-alpha-trypsin n=1 Tax=Clostridium magnum DSM 2767 TaxID=1121326 RepID=A0A161YKV4_9CLOT|nr:VIT and VWA domain-containing protein [Clostridium magnum]KZL91182.1 vault protein inter-alpha-trypsin [Clostridium magnum DSM 2767]SHI17543.1 Ca-activated chloride channel family protein [Clostridium magnum DSM 2767]